jgi:hypothetical protein
MTVLSKVLAAASGSLLICCSAAGPEADAPPSATVQSGSVDAPVPPPPDSPLPSGFNFPGSGDATSAPPAPAPALGTRRVIWASAGNQLLELTSDASTKVDAHEVAGLAPGEQLVGLDFRKNGTLYGVGTTSRLFSIAPKSATAAAISSAPFAAPLDGTAFGFGFDPISDLARVASNTSENIRIEAETGTVTNVDGPLHYAAGDANANALPRVSAVAYAADGAGYALDAQTGSLARIVDSYSGELETIGALGVTVTDIGGFDIAGKDAFAALRVGSVTSLYAVDLASGKVVSIGKIGDGGPVSGLAIQP